MDLPVFSKRVQAVEPFEVMEILARAAQLEKEGRKIIHLEIGEPDFPTPERVILAAARALRSGETHYTDARGIPELREAIAENYRAQTGTPVIPETEILVTGGVSQALFYVLAAVVEKGTEVMYFEPGYSCYPNFARFFDGIPVPVELQKEKGFRIDPGALEEKITPRTRVLILNTPSNPTGTCLEKKELKEILEICAENGVFAVSDEIYSGLVYGRERAPSAGQWGFENVAVLDGFSKTYAMTGWRLGYGVWPEALRGAAEKLQQNFYISPSAFIQKPAVEAFKAKPEVQKMKAEFNRRRAFLSKRLKKIPGLKFAEPAGAYYFFPDFSAYSPDSKALAETLLEKGGVALTPGSAFGRAGEGHLRISYASSLENLKEGLERLEKVLADSF